MTSKMVREIIEKFFKGNKIVDEEAYERAREGLHGEDRQFLDDLRDAAFEHEDFDEEEIRNALVDLPEDDRDPDA